MTSSWYCFQTQTCVRLKRRPALVVQADGLGTQLPQTIVAMISSNMSRAGHPSRVAVTAGSRYAKQSGLLTDSVVMADNLATIRYSEIDQVIGTIPDLTDLEVALRATLGL